MKNESSPYQQYLDEYERRLNTTSQPQKLKATGQPQKSTIASNIARIAVYTSLILGAILAGKCSADSGASVAGKRARASILAVLPETPSLTPTNKRTLECLAGRIGVRCQGVSRLGKDDFESKNCDPAELNALDNPDRSKESNLIALATKAKKVAAKAGITPRFMCNTSSDGAQLKITIDRKQTKE